MSEPTGRRVGFDAVAGNEQLHLRELLRRLRTAPYRCNKPGAGEKKGYSGHNQNPPPLR